MVERGILRAAVLTLATLAISCAMAPHLGLPSPFIWLPLQYWLTAVVGAMAAATLLATAGMAARRIATPLQTIRQSLDRQRLQSAVIGGLLVAISFAAFGIVKTEIDVMPFTADLAIAAVDRAILGMDAWQFFAWARHPGMGEAYHAIWLGWVFLILALLLWQRPSAWKDTAVFSYFLLWTVGPLVHLAAPAMGPVLFDAMSGHHRFAGLQVVATDAQKFDYLVAGWRDQVFNPGGGISAMPSLHIATMAWTVLTTWRWTVLRWLSVAITIYMWIASVALGWHYLLDGLAGVAVAALCWTLAAHPRTTRQSSTRAAFG